MFLGHLLISFMIIFNLSESIVISSEDETNGISGITEPEWKKVKGSHSRFLTAHYILQKDQILGDREIFGRNISRLKPKFLRNYPNIRSRKNIAPQQQETFHKKHYSRSYTREIIPGHSNNGSFQRTKIIQTPLPAVRHSVDSSHLPDALLLYPIRKASQNSEIAFNPALPILRNSRSSFLPFGTSKNDAIIIRCLPERINYRLHYPCNERNSEEEEREEAIMTGRPTRLAKTGFYDRLFRNANTIQWQGKYAYYPTYGFNPNLPFGVYRYSNFFNKPMGEAK